MPAFHPSRRQFLAACGAPATAVGAVFGGNASEAAPNDGSWPLGRGDVANTGVADGPGPRSGVRTRWTFEEHLVSRKPPVVADNRLYVGCFEDTAAFVALNASTGAEVRRADLGDRGDVRFPESAAAVADGTVVEATRTHAETAFDGTLSRPARYGLRFGTGGPANDTFGSTSRERMFGHVGLGSVLGWGDPELNVGLAYVTKRHPRGVL